MSQSKRVALGHERSLTLLPPIFKLSFCVLLLSSRSFPVSGVKLPPWLAPSQDFFPFILPLYRNALPIPQLFLHLQSDEVAPKWREWHSRKNGDPTCLFLNTSFLDKCLECHLHMLYFCFFLSHSFLNLCQCDPHTYAFSTQQVFNAPRKAKSEEHAQSLSLLELLQYLQLPLSWAFPLVLNWHILSFWFLPVLYSSILPLRKELQRAGRVLASPYCSKLLGLPTR